jgi:osmotically-inducible protein OsmY
MKTILVLIIGVAIGAGIYWYYHNPDADQRLQQVRSDVTSTISNIDVQQVKDQLAQKGEVVLKKAESAGEKLADATADARITAAIKTKYAREPQLSALSISVNTTGGKVTLSGWASSPEAIKTAMNLAIQTDGVSEVVSTLQVKSSSPQ